MPGKRATFTPPGHLCFLHALSFYKYTPGEHILYDLRCNAGGPRPIKVRNEIRHEAVDGVQRITVHALNKDE